RTVVAVLREKLFVVGDGAFEVSFGFFLMDGGAEQSFRSIRFRCGGFLRDDRQRQNSRKDQACNQCSSHCYHLYVLAKVMRLSVGQAQVKLRSRIKPVTDAANCNEMPRLL